MKIIITFTLLTISIICHSQGLKFETQSWNVILQHAKKENKPVFVDIYASWCMPCKKMSSEVFTKDSVAKAYNSNFICCQIDIESTDGALIKNKYDIRYFPTFLFVREDGTLFYKKVGTLDLNSFINLSVFAMKEFNDHNTIQKWDVEFERKKDDKEFLLNYINKRANQGLPYMTIFEYYLRLAPIEKQINDEIAKIFSLDMDMIYVGSFAYDYLISNIQRFNEIWRPRMESLLLFYFNQTVLKAKMENNLTLFEKTMTYYDRIFFNDISISKADVYKFFYDINN